MNAGMSQAGEAIFEGEDGRGVHGIFSFNRWHWPLAIRFFMESPLNKITVKTGAMFKAMTLESSIVLPAPSLTTPEPLVTLVDPTKEQTANWK